MMCGNSYSEAWLKLSNILGASCCWGEEHGGRLAKGCEAAVLHRNKWSCPQGLKTLMKHQLHPTQQTNNG